MNPRLRRLLQVPASRLDRLQRELLDIRSGDPLTRRFAHFGVRSRVQAPYRDLGNPASIWIGDDVQIWAGAAFEALAPPGAVIIEIGDRCVFGYGVRLVAVNGIHIAADCALGHGVTVADTIHDWKTAGGVQASWQTPLKRGRSLRIEPGAWIGNNCVVTGGITIGRGAVIAPNVVVTQDVPPETLIAGSPAVPQRHRNEDGKWERLTDSAIRDVAGG